MRPQPRPAQQFTATISGPLKGDRATAYQGSFHAARAWLLNAILRQAAYWVARDQEGDADAPSTVAVLVDAAMVLAVEEGAVDVVGDPYLFVLEAQPVPARPL